MAYFTANTENGVGSSVTATGRYGFVRLEKVDTSDNAVKVIPRNGKKYVVFLNETAKGNYVGEKMFTRYVFRVVITDGKVHIWMKTIGGRQRKTSPGRDSWKQSSKYSWNDPSFTPRRRYTSWK